MISLYLNNAHKFFSLLEEMYSKDLLKSLLEEITGKGRSYSWINIKSQFLQYPFALEKSVEIVTRNIVVQHRLWLKFIKSDLHFLLFYH